MFNIPFAKLILLASILMPLTSRSEKLIIPSSSGRDLKGLFNLNLKFLSLKLPAEVLKFDSFVLVSCDVSLSLNILSRFVVLSVSL